WPALRHSSLGPRPDRQSLRLPSTILLRVTSSVMPAHSLRLPQLEAVAFRVTRPAETPVVVVLDFLLDLRAGGSELRQHGVEVFDAVVHHERRRTGAEVSRVWGKC